MKALQMAHTSDPKVALNIDTSGVQVFHNQILIAVYKRPEKTASGIHLPDQVRKEDEYQGKVGLVLQKGPLAFRDDARAQFLGQNVNVGDWVVIRASDGWQLLIGDTLCRMVTDLDVKLKINSPDLVF